MRTEAKLIVVAGGRRQRRTRSDHNAHRLGRGRGIGDDASHRKGEGGAARQVCLQQRGVPVELRDAGGARGVRDEEDLGAPMSGR